MRRDDICRGGHEVAFRLSNELMPESACLSKLPVSSTWDFFSIEASSRLRCAIDPSKYRSMTIIEVFIEPIEPMSLQFESPTRDPSDWTTE